MILRSREWDFALEIELFQYSFLDLVVLFTGQK